MIEKLMMTARRNLLDRFSISFLRLSKYFSFALLILHLAEFLTSGKILILSSSIFVGDFMSKKITFRPKRIDVILEILVIAFFAIVTALEICFGSPSIIL